MSKQNDADSTVAKDLRQFAGVFRQPAPKPLAPSGPVTIVDRGGAVLDHVEVYLIYWGTYWSFSPVAPIQSAGVTLGIQTILGPYMAGLNQYRGIQPGTLVGTTFVNSDPPSPFGDSDVTNLISGLITQGRVPNPTGSQLFYCVMLPVGAIYSKNVKDDKDGKAYKDQKDHQDSKNASDRASAAGGAPSRAADKLRGGAEYSELWNEINNLSTRVTQVEARLAQGRSFIREQERPPVGDYALQYNSAIPADLLGIVGLHDFFGLTDLPGAPRVRWGWVSNDGSTDWMTRVFSHELAEACTDPDPFSGFVVTSGCDFGGDCEIGDLCEDSVTRINQVLVQQYWSAKDSACTVPGKADKDNKDNKEGKDKDNKDNKDTKDHKDHKDRDAKIGDVKAKESEGLTDTSLVLPNLRHSVGALEQRVLVIERQLEQTKSGSLQSEQAMTAIGGSKRPKSRRKRTRQENA